MEFDFSKRECDFGTVYSPTVPIIINGFSIGHAFIDTGADITILPLEVNTILELELDTEKSIELASAGGGKFRAIPSLKKVTLTIEHSGFKPIIWKGIVYFAPRQPTILLGQYQCLTQLKVTLDGPRRKVIVHPQ